MQVLDTRFMALEPRPFDILTPVGTHAPSTFFFERSPRWTTCWRARVSGWGAANEPSLTPQWPRRIAQSMPLRMKIIGSRFRLAIVAPQYVKSSQTFLVCDPCHSPTPYTIDLGS